MYTFQACTTRIETRATDNISSGSFERTISDAVLAMISSHSARVCSDGPFSA